MSETTNIEWATSTGNPWIGCTKVSPGCKNCYAAEMDANRFSRSMGQGTPEKPESHWGKDAPRVRTKAFWKDALKWNRDAGLQQTCGDCDPCIGGRPEQCAISPIRRPRIFPSLCDWLDDEVPIEWLADFLTLALRRTPNLDWLLLTKRPHLWRERLTECIHKTHCDPTDTNDIICSWLDGNAPRNIWIGTSVEDQQRAGERIPLLLTIPAKIRFLSVEPLLERVNLGRWVYPFPPNSTRPKGDISWVIVGAESGKDRRDCGVEALVDVAQQCVAAAVDCFVKQDCAFKPGQRGRLPAAIWALKQFPA